MKITVLCGGVGGSKLVLGLHSEFPRDELTIVANTGDDLTILGLHVSPDVDTIMYTLAGVSNQETGWGLEFDTFQMLTALSTYGQDSWFRLGDRDMTTHLVRTHAMANGASLTDVTAILARALGVTRTVLPMTHDVVATKVRTARGWLSFQEYFVKYGHADTPLEVRHEGAEFAAPTPQVIAALTDSDLVVIAPSNPVVSIGPILALPGIVQALDRSPAPKIAVSPFIDNRSITGPADLLMGAVGREPGSTGLLSLYGSWLDVLIVNDGDIADVAANKRPILKATDTLMPDLAAKRRLARFVVDAVT